MLKVESALWWNHVCKITTTKYQYSLALALLCKCVCLKKECFKLLLEKQLGISLACKKVIVKLISWEELVGLILAL